MEKFTNHFYFSMDSTFSLILFQYANYEIVSARKSAHAQLQTLSILCWTASINYCVILKGRHLIKSNCKMTVHFIFVVQLLVVFILNTPTGMICAGNYASFAPGITINTLVYLITLKRALMMYYKINVK